MIKSLYIAFALFSSISIVPDQNITKTLENLTSDAYELRNLSPAQAISIAEETLLKSLDQKNYKVEIQCRYILGHIYTNHGEYTKAKENLTIAIQVGQKQQLTILQARAENYMGNLYLKKGDYERAISFYKKTKDIFLENKKMQDYTFSITNIGICYMYSAQYDSASILYHNALQTIQKIDNKSFEGYINNNLGRLHLKIKDYSKAKDFINKSIELFKLTNNNHSLARSLLLLSEIEFNESNTNAAIKFAKEATEITKKVNDNQNLVNAFMLMGKIYESTNFVEKADSIFQEGISLAQKHSLKRNLNEAFLNYATFLFNIKEYEKSEKFALATIQLSEEIHYNKNNLDGYTLLEKIYSVTNRVKLAYEILKKRSNANLKIQELEQEVKTLEISNDLQKAEAEGLKNTQLIYWLIIGITITLAIIAVYFFYYRSKLNKKLFDLRMNESLLREKNLKISKDREIESIKAEIKGQESERERLAKELHDGLGGTLSSIKLNLSFMQDEYKIIEPLDNVINKLDEACNEVRTISHHLTPPIFENNLLSEAIKNYITDIESNTQLKINCDVFPVEEIERIQPPLKNDLYRIIQELTTNIIKHAQAENIDIQLIQHEDHISLLVEDDGKGFNESNKSKGIGLKNIEVRLALHNGELTLDTRLSRGTSINIRIPT